MLQISAKFKYKGSNNNFKLDSNLKTHSSGVTAIFGPSGSGKSTLFKIIAGLLNSPSVKIKLNNETIYDSRQKKWSPPNERRIGYVFQDTRLFPHLNVKDNLQFAIRFNPNSRIRDLSFENIIDTLNLEDLLNKNINHLSGGEKQLVSIGRALMANPNILLLDEPLGALDYERKKIIIPYLEKLCLDCKIPILYISHNIDEIKSFANWVAIMKNGEISSFGSLEDMGDQIDISLINEGRKTKTVLDSTISRHDKINKLSILNIGKQNLTIPIVSNKTGGNIKVRIKPQDVGIACNKNAIPYDPNPPKITSGLRFGTAAATSRGFNDSDFRDIGKMISEILDNIDQNEDNQNQFISSMKTKVIDMCKKYPIYDEAF